MRRSSIRRAMNSLIRWNTWRKFDRLRHALDSVKSFRPRYSGNRPSAPRSFVRSFKEWQPPFCVNVDEFRFTPRIQRIHELEAGARAKMKFYERLAKLFESQGMKFKIPTVERESLDLAKLHKVCSLNWKVNGNERFVVFFYSIRSSRTREGSICVLPKIVGPSWRVKCVFTTLKRVAF